MTRPLPPPAPAPLPGRRPALIATRDCDVCIVGADAAGLLLACDLAARGSDVVLIPLPGDDITLEIDSALAPGFRLSAPDLLGRVGRADAGELLALSAEAARRGVLLAQEAGVALGPRGRLMVARPHAAAQLAAEQEALARLAPDTSLLLPAADIRELLGTDAFVLALGRVPAHRVDAAAFRDVLAAAAAEGGLTLLPPAPDLEADVRGLRKYLTTPDLKVRAYQVVFSGGIALRRLVPELAPSLVPMPWVSGRFHVPGAGAAYAGLVEEAGTTGRRWSWDADHLSIAAETATWVRGRAAATRVLRRHAAACGHPAGASGEAARAVMLASTRRAMPLVQEGEKGVWYCATIGGEELAHAVLGAELIGRAITDRDDRIRLLRPFGLEPAGTRPVSRLARMGGYWRCRLAETLWPGPEAADPAGDGAAAQAAAGPLPPPRTGHLAPVRGGASAAVAFSRRAALAAGRLAFGAARRPSAD
ncbi:FAD-dependent oxidoreductase [Xanthobacter sp. V4C-4]|uniref:FAD-dependent oxidoreductase n=1 Tax=Xanthobacter cornucopiae TaxID=3119924 RepID=UPI00372A2F55